MFALTYGIWQMKTGDRAMSQKMMRLRVAAQGFTVVALLGGVFYSAHQAKKKRIESSSSSSYGLLPYNIIKDFPALQIRV